MGTEGFSSKPVNKGETGMNAEESLNKKVIQTTSLIRTFAEMFLRNKAGNRAGAWGMLEKVGLAGSDLREMDKVTLTPALSRLEELLKPLGEAIPRTNDEMKALIVQLDTKSFQEKIRANLSSISK